MQSCWFVRWRRNCLKRQIHSHFTWYGPFSGELSFENVYQDSDGSHTNPHAQAVFLRPATCAKWEIAFAKVRQTLDEAGVIGKALGGRWNSSGNALNSLMGNFAALGSRNYSSLNFSRGSDVEVDGDAMQDGEGGVVGGVVEGGDGVSSSKLLAPAALLAATYNGTQYVGAWTKGDGTVVYGCRLCALQRCVIIYIHIDLCIHVRMYMYVYICLCISIWKYGHIRVCKYINIYIYIYLRM